MIVRMPSEWDAIRDQFDNEEKGALNAAISGEAICPRGIIIDVEKLHPELQIKLTNALEQARKQRRTNEPTR